MRAADPWSYVMNKNVWKPYFYNVQSFLYDRSRNLSSLGLCTVVSNIFGDILTVLHQFFVIRNWNDAVTVAFFVKNVKKPVFSFCACLNILNSKDIKYFTISFWIHPDLGMSLLFILFFQPLKFSKPRLFRVCTSVILNYKCKSKNAHCNVWFDRSYGISSREFWTNGDTVFWFKNGLSTKPL